MPTINLTQCKKNGSPLCLNGLCENTVHFEQEVEFKLKLINHFSIGCLRTPKGLYVFTSVRSLGNGRIGSGSSSPILLIEAPVERKIRNNVKLEFNI